MVLLEVRQAEVLHDLELDLEELAAVRCWVAELKEQ